MSEHTCPCGARRGLFHECLVCNCVGKGLVALGTAIAAFVRACRVRELVEDIMRTHYAAVDAGTAHQALLRSDPERARLCVARLDRAYVEHHAALTELATLAIEGAGR